MSLYIYLQGENRELKSKIKSIENEKKVNISKPVFRILDIVPLVCNRFHLFVLTEKWIYRAFDKIIYGYDLWFYKTKNVDFIQSKDREIENMKTGLQVFISYFWILNENL